MIESNGISAKIVKETLETYQKAGDLNGFLSFVKDLKAAAFDLVEQCFPGVAADILNKYNQFFNEYESDDPAFTYGILHLFPVNKSSTMKLLGMSDQIDEAIHRYKLNSQTFSRARFDSVPHLVRWALKKNDTQFLEAFIKHVAQDLLNNHPDDSASRISASGEIIFEITWETEFKYKVSSEIDEAIASIIIDDYSTLLPEFWLSMARAGMPKSMLQMATHQRIQTYLPRHFCTKNSEKISRDEHEEICNCFPMDLSPEVTCRVVEAVSHTALMEKVISDESFDIDAFIGAMSWRKERDYSFSRLNSFKNLFTEEFLNTSAKKRRAAKILDEIADKAHKWSKKEKTVSESFKSSELPESARMLVRMFKVKQLENELGV